MSTPLFALNKSDVEQTSWTREVNWCVTWFQKIEENKSVDRKTVDNKKKTTAFSRLEIECLYKK